jgi:uncharacterized surface protein with fasciclin (FAS1) repeats
MNRLLMAFVGLGVVLASATAAPLPSRDILETAIETGAFKVLVAVLREGGLADTLKGKGPFTVFAPNDDAFKKIPAETLQALFKDRKALPEMLNYHIVAGELKVDDVMKRKSVKTLQGDEIRIEVADGKLKLNGTATVVKSEIPCANGVIHVIDTVLLPPKK